MQIALLRLFLICTQSTIDWAPCLIVHYCLWFVVVEFNGKTADYPGVAVRTLLPDAVVVSGQAQLRVQGGVRAVKHSQRLLVSAFTNLFILENVSKSMRFWSMWFQWTHWLRVNTGPKQKNIVPLSEKPIFMWIDPEFHRTKLVVAVLHQQRSTVVGIPTGSGKMNNPTNTAHLLLWVVYIKQIIIYGRRGEAFPWSIYIVLPLLYTAQ